MKALIALLCSCLLAACGSTKSLSPQTTVPYGIVIVNDSLRVSGPILAEDARSITIAAYGVSQTYIRSAVQRIERVEVPDDARIREENARNTARTASNTGVMMAISLISLVAAAIAVTK